MLQDRLNAIVNKHKATIMMKVADGKTLMDHLHEFWNSDNKWAKLQEYGSKGLDWAQANPGKTALGGTALLAAITDPLGVRRSFSDNRGQSNNGGSNIANWIVPLLGGGLIYAGLSTAAGLKRTNDNVNNLIANADDAINSAKNTATKVSTAADNVSTAAESAQGVTDAVKRPVQHLTGEAAIKASEPITDSTWYGVDTMTGKNITFGELKKMTPDQRKRVKQLPIGPWWERVFTSLFK